MKILNLKSVILLEYQNTKTFFAKSSFSNWSEEVFVIKKIKNTVPWTYVISDLNEKKLSETFTKKYCKKKIEKSLELKK